MREAVACWSLLAAIVTAGCGGPSDEELQAAQRDAARLKADLDSANKRHADDEQKYAEAKAQIDDLKVQVRAFGEVRSAPPSNAEANTVTATPPIAGVPSGWRQISQGSFAHEALCLVTVSVSLEGAAAFDAARRDSTIRTAFVKWEYDSKKGCPKEKWKTVIVRDRFDCGQRKREPLASSFFDWSDTRSDTTYPGDGSLATTIFPDDSTGDLVWKYVCGSR